MINDTEYVYIILDDGGKTWRVLDNDHEEAEGLPSLFKQGWRPIRETPYGDGTYFLILLERPVVKGNVGFGIE
jgi:hypothetical protein